MTKVIQIVENNHITGIVYGTVEYPDAVVRHNPKSTNVKTQISKAKIKQMQKSRIKQK
ncbi:MAG: hypothetical protein IKZ34_02880 [Alphaproteobacteria bacterium]|nr:hypothetical protein [Alphaproteobacteria bacterium]